MIKQTIPFKEIAGMSLEHAVNSSSIHHASKERSKILGQQSADVIKATMSSLHLSDIQQAHLNALSAGTASIVITGQQPGFLGGPLYSLYKAITCVSIAESYSTDESPVIPVFWIEDNDHDGMEAGIGTIIDSNGALHSISCDELEILQSRMSVSERTFSEDISNIIQHISTLLPNTEYGQSIVQELQEIYRPGISWSTAFLTLMHHRCSEYGLLFFSASKARTLGLFSEILYDELSNPGKLKSCVDIANDELAYKNFPIQSEAGMINAFYHDENGNRLKVEYIDETTRRIGERVFSISDMEQFFKEHNNQFSPNVLLRPLIQDSILPTIAMIVGPGEAKYMAQLPHAYTTYAIQMPSLFSRHSSTVIPPSIEKYVNKYDLNVQSFFKTMNEIEQELSKKFAYDDEIDASFNELRSAIATSIGTIQHFANSIDPSLQGAVSATEHGIEKQLENLQKKMTSGLKKKHDQLFLKAHEAHNWLYPNNHLQERVLSSVAIESKLGIQGLRGVLLEMKQADRGEHLIVIS